jgi:HlyD family secretion protein
MDKGVKAVKLVKSRRVTLLLVAAVLALSLVGYLLRGYLSGNESSVRVSGNIEVIDAQLSFKIAGRVAERLVREGDAVREGQLIARLESSELEHEVALRRAEADAARAVLAEFEAGSRPEEIAQAEAAMLQAKARLEELEAGSRPQEVAAAEAAVARARAEAERATADFERYDGLYRLEIVSAERRDQARAAIETAEARLREAEEQLKLVQEGPRREQIEQARAALRQAKEHYELVRKGPRRETIAQARARHEQARQALAVAETRLGYATLLAPFAGVVLSENIEPGEFVTAGTPVVTLGNIANVWLRAYINETDLGRVKLGQRARVTTDTYRGKSYDGRVTFISSEAEFTPRSVQTHKERVKLVYRIKIDIANPHRELKPGMPADAEILLDTSGEAE